MKKSFLLFLCAVIFGINALKAQTGEELTVDFSDCKKNSVTNAIAEKNKQRKEGEEPVTENQITTVNVTNGPIYDGNCAAGRFHVSGIFSNVQHLAELTTLNMGSAKVAKDRNGDGKIDNEELKAIGEIEFVVSGLHNPKLKSVTLPYGTVRFNTNSFGNNPPLEEINFPGTIESIGDVFKDCYNLKKIKAEWTTNPPKVAGNAFPPKTSERILNVPKGSKSEYVKNGWENFFVIKDPAENRNISGTTDAGVTVAAYLKNDMQRSLLKAAPEGYTLEATTISDAEGNYAFESLREGVYIIMVEIEGYESQPSAVIEITAESKPATGIDFTVDHENRTVRPVIPVSGVSLNKPEITLTVGGTETLIATVEPADATNQTVTWGSSNTAAATVSDDGTVTAIAAGEAVVTATTRDGAKTATCAVTVQSLTGVSELWNIDLKIYPNPFTGTVRITGTDAEAARAPILRVIDAAGVAVHVQKITNPDETIRLEHLPAGVYFFRLEMDGKAKTVKAIKN